MGFLTELVGHRFESQILILLTEFTKSCGKFMECFEFWEAICDNQFWKRRSIYFGLLTGFEHVQLSGMVYVEWI